MAKKNEKTVKIQLRRYQALELKLAGSTIREIAVVQGISHVQVHHDIKKVLGEMADATSKQADHLRAMTMARYEKLLQAHWHQAMAGDYRSTEMCLSVLGGQRAIAGLDAPTQVTGADGGPLKISIDELAKMAEVNGYFPTEEIPPRGSLPEFTES